MDIEKFRKHCKSIKGAEESFSSIRYKILVFKVMGKIFVYLPLKPEDGKFKAYLKCNPEKSIELREKYNGITSDKFKTLLWNWVALEGDVSDDLIKKLLLHSVEEVVKKLPKKKQEEYRELNI